MVRKFSNYCYGATGKREYGFKMFMIAKIINLNKTTNIKTIPIASRYFITRAVNNLSSMGVIKTNTRFALPGQRFTLVLSHHFQLI